MNRSSLYNVRPRNTIVGIYTFNNNHITAVVEHVNFHGLDS